jgi:hypothetical protein
MPLATEIDCPACGDRLVRKPGGRCPHCGADVRRHVTEERGRQIRIDQIVAVISTILVLGLSLFVGGCNVIEGVLVYAAAGAVVWVLAKKTFW